MRRPPALLAIAAALVLGVAATGCSNPCRDLGDRICNCVPEGQTRTACRNDVKTRVSDANPTSDQQDYCTNLLDTCPDPSASAEACNLMQTCWGKVACGMAYPQPGTDPGTFCATLPAATAAGAL